MKTLLWVCLFISMGFAKSNEIAVGAYNLIGLLLDDAVILQGQYSREITPKVWGYLEYFHMDITEKFERDINDLSVIKKEQEKEKLYEFGIYYYPWTDENGEGFFLRSSVGYVQTYFSTIGFENEKSGVTAIGGIGYKKVLWESLALSGGARYSVLGYKIENPNENDSFDGSTDGAGLPPVLVELNLGYRF